MLGGTVPQPVTSAGPGAGDSTSPQRFQTLAADAGRLSKPTTSTTSVSFIPGLCHQHIHAPSRQHSSSPLVLLKTGRDGPALFIVTGLGGTAADVFSLARNMRCSNPVYALQARGLDGAEAPLEHVRDLAQYYLAAVQAQQPEDPICSPAIRSVVWSRWKWRSSWCKRGSDRRCWRSWNLTRIHAIGRAPYDPQSSHV